MWPVGTPRDHRQAPCVLASTGRPSITLHGGASRDLLARIVRAHARVNTYRNDRSKRPRVGFAREGEWVLLFWPNILVFKANTTVTIIPRGHCFLGYS